MKILSSKIGKVAVLSALAAVQMGSGNASAAQDPVIKDIYVSVSCDSARTYPKYLSAIATVPGVREELPKFIEMQNVRITRDFWDAQLKIDWSPLANTESYVGPDYLSARFIPGGTYAKKGGHGFLFDRDRKNASAADSKREFFEMRPIVSDGRESGSVKCFEKVRQFELTDLLAKEMRGQ